MIYFDNAATTYPKPEEVYIALDKANRNDFNTGRGSYKCAREASEIKEAVRNKILASSPPSSMTTSVVGNAFFTPREVAKTS